MIKIPPPPRAARRSPQTLAEGISVNVTLIFGLDRYRDVMEAYLAGLEQATENGHDLSKIHSVASFFVSRVDTEIDKRLDAIGDRAGRRRCTGKAGVANARLAYQAYEEFFAGERWAALEAAGANRQRPLWASTGVKNPDYRDTMYVTDLVVATPSTRCPRRRMRGRRRPRRGQGRPGHHATTTTRSRCMDDLGTLGIDYDDVIEVLEHEGVDKFVKSWHELLETVSGQLEQAAGRDVSEHARGRRRPVPAADAVAAHVAAARRRRVRRPARRAGRHAVGPGRRGGGREAAVLGRPAPSLAPAGREIAALRAELRRRASTTSCCAAWAGRRWRPRSSARRTASS